MSFNRSTVTADYSGKGKNYDIKTWNPNPYKAPALKVIHNLSPISTDAPAQELGVDVRYARAILQSLEADGRIVCRSKLWEVV